MLKFSLGLNAVLLIVVAVLLYARISIGTSYFYYRRALSSVASASVEELRKGNVERVKQALAEIRFEAVNDGLTSARQKLGVYPLAKKEPNQSPEPTR